MARRRGRGAEGQNETRAGEIRERKKKKKKKTTTWTQDRRNRCEVREGKRMERREDWK